jgi:hypothetical protein
MTWADSMTRDGEQLAAIPPSAAMTKSPAAAHAQPRRARGRRLDERVGRCAAMGSNSSGDQLSPA